MSDIDVLIRGQHYRVRMVIPGVWNAPREAVMRYMYTDGTTLVFDLRPLMGTQEIDVKYVVKITKTDDKVKEPRIVPVGKR